ncbi:hypothetical protein CLAIMM_01495 [Cladophialophora immunda]|nr:hypothetical protein CLAIMM_01495 [Cladophialophora immunda]
MKVSPLVWVLLAKAIEAAPQPITASSGVGATTSDVYPPASTSVDSSQFPPESVVQFPGPTLTGLEPAAAQTAPLYPYNTLGAAAFPLVAAQPQGSNSSSKVHLLYRHGARYPTSGAAPATFAAKLANATKGAGFQVTGELAFLSDWSYKLGAELLTPFGRSQNFQLGVAYRQLYGELLNNFTAQGALPVFRTESQDRMVKTAENFAAGFFGVPEYMDQVNIEILVETPGVNNSGAPYEVCNNSNIASKGSIGSTVATQFANNAFNVTLARLNSQISGNLTLTPTDAIAMLQLCSYETDALGYSAFCDLFTQQDFENYEYYYDLSFYYNNGPGSPVAAAQGKGYLEEFVARFTHTYPAALSALNETFDDTPTYFPLNQSIYADATHEVVVLDTLTAFNFTALFNGPALNTKSNTGSNNFVASMLVPFATHFTAQVLECPAMSPSKQIRFIVNDAVIPVSDSHPGCPVDPNGLCPFDNMVKVLQQRINEIDFNYDCYANYTATAGVNYNGRAPRNAPS